MDEVEVRSRSSPSSINARGIKPLPRFNPSEFVHLHTHSHYSLLDGLQKIPEMLDRVEKLGMSSVALTDHGTMSGTIEFYRAAKARGIKPIVGIETYIAPRTHIDKEGKQDANPNHLILLAMNNQGYQNLMTLSSIAYLEGFYYKPRIDHDLLEKHNEGLIVLSACLSGEIGSALRQNQYDQAKTIAQRYKRIFGDRYYLEVQDHGHIWEEQKAVNDQILNLASELDIKVVVTADAHYSAHEDQDAHEVLLCVQTGSKLTDEKRMSLKDLPLFVSDPKELALRWDNSILRTSAEVAQRCNVEIEFGKLLIPRFPTDSGEDEYSYLEKLAYQGLAWRYGNKTRKQSQELNKAEIKKMLPKEHIGRMEFELSVMKKMGFAGYFLIVSDFINWAKERGIIIGPGRGSAAGSIVAYALNITELDPLKYNLLFERFLNPERISMPDVDIDFQDDRRDEVIDYVIKKYGKDQVAQIVTFGKMAARNAIRDTARVLDVPYGDADRLAKLVPPPVQGRHVPLAKAIKENPELKKDYATNKTSKEVIDLAIRLEGTIRSHGVHAAGVVIAPDVLTKFTPLEIAQKGVVSTQYSMGPIEDLGLLKMDFLGLSNLTIIKNALRIIRKVYKKTIEIGNVPLDDPKVFELLSKGNTTGVFQLESPGMKRYLKELKPTNFDDIIAMVSLYRPGPMAELPRYIQGKHNPGKVTYPHPTLEPILKDTYGVMVYQEQIIAMLQLIAGYSPGQADLVRKAIGKKKRDIMDAEEPKFIEGCLKRGLTNDGANKLWKLIQPFADYSFNKSHAACYALIAYRTAYLKAHYPSAFMAALLTSDFENSERVAIEISECRHMGIEVLPPDINESFVEFAVVPQSGAIRFGMSAIKNVGVGAVEKILTAREDGAFSSVEDFARRVSAGDVNKKTWESLIKTGAFDSLADRQKLLFNMNKILAFTSRVQKDAVLGQTDLFGTQANGSGISLSLNLDNANGTATEQEWLRWERELLGLYLSHSPLDEYNDYLADHTYDMSMLSEHSEDETVTVGGLITAARRITTKNGSNMAFVTIEAAAGSIEIIVFPKVFEGVGDILETDRVIQATGKISSKDRDGNSGPLKLLADKIQEINQEMVERAAAIAKIRQEDGGFLRSPAPSKKAGQVAGNQELIIEIPNVNEADKLAEMKEMLFHHVGDYEVIVVINGDPPTRIKLPFKVKSSPELIKEVQRIMNNDQVKVSAGVF